MDDYIVIVKKIADILDRQGCPLTDEQESLLMGALIGYQMAIKDIGLNKVISNLKEQDSKQ